MHTHTNLLANIQEEIKHTLNIRTVTRTPPPYAPSPSLSPFPPSHPIRAFDTPTLQSLLHVKAEKKMNKKIYMQNMFLLREGEKEAREKDSGREREREPDVGEERPLSTRVASTCISDIEYAAEARKTNGKF
jgi:hypothetical protein